MRLLACIKARVVIYLLCHIYSDQGHMHIEEQKRLEFVFLVDLRLAMGI